MDSSETLPKPRSNLVLWLVLALCFVPVAGSSLLYFFWTPLRFVNHGELIDPVALAGATVHQVNGRSFHFSDLNGRWILLSIDDSICNDHCREKLYLMRQIRLTQGKDAERIERVWLIRNAQQPLPELSATYRGTREIVMSEPTILDNFPGGANRTDYIYLLDPMGNLMMRFQRDVEPNRMKKDISKLLRLSSGWRQIKPPQADVNG